MREEREGWRERWKKRGKMGEQREEREMNEEGMGGRE